MKFLSGLYAGGIFVALLLYGCNVVDTQADAASGATIAYDGNILTAANLTTGWSDVVEMPVLINPGVGELYARFVWEISDGGDKAEIQYTIGGLSSALAATDSDIPVTTEPIRMPNPPQGWQTLRIRVRGKATLLGYVLVAR